MAFFVWRYGSALECTCSFVCATPPHHTTLCLLHRARGGVTNDKEVKKKKCRNQGLKDQTRSQSEGMSVTSDLRLKLFPLPPLRMALILRRPIQADHPSSWNVSSISSFGRFLRPTLINSLLNLWLHSYIWKGEYFLRPSLGTPRDWT